ncbi:hypothetical protein D3C71_1916350 [compost metagenome]
MENSTTISTNQRVRAKKLCGNHSGVFMDSYRVRVGWVSGANESAMTLGMADAA